MKRINNVEASLVLRALEIDSSLSDTRVTAPWHSNINIYPYQLECVYKAISMKKVRMMLCDEPGLGKTIEAGLILKELYESDRISNVLIVVPAGLRWQWKSELEQKLSLPTEVVDAKNLEILEEERVGAYITSFAFFRNRYERFASLEWDMFIVDEAHHASWRSAKDSKTYSYQSVSSMAKKVQNVLLLTATPVQLGYYDFWSLINILRPDLFPDYNRFILYIKNYLPTVSDLRQDAARGEPVADDISFLESRALKLFGLHLDPTMDIDTRLSRLSILDDFIIRHRKRSEFSSMVEREALTKQVQYTEKEMQVYEEISEYLAHEYKMSRELGQRGRGFLAVIFKQLLTSSPKALLATIHKRSVRLENLMDTVTEESEYELKPEEMQEQYDAMQSFEERLASLQVDSKLIALTQFVSKVLLKDPSEKIIIFTRFLETQKYLARILSEQFRVSCFNGNLGQIEKDKNIEEFKTRSQVLISTEAGGEGRNLQFAHIMVNYDLPWNPVRLEQRIGRIDRLGQDRKVTVVNMATWDTVEQKIFERLVERLGVWEETIGVCDTMLGGLEKEISSMLLDSGYDEYMFEKVLEEKMHLAREASGYFKRLELFKGDEDMREEIEKELRKVASPDKIKEFLKAFASHEGFSYEEVGEQNKNILLGTSESGKERLREDELRPTNPTVKRLINKILPRDGILYSCISDQSDSHRFYVFIRDAITKEGILVSTDGSAWEVSKPDDISFKSGQTTGATVDEVEVKGVSSDAVLYSQKILGYDHLNLRPMLMIKNTKPR